MSRNQVPAIGDICAKATSLGDFIATFNHLKLLNQILVPALPSNLRNICHIGSFDLATSTVVLFVNNQQALHILKNMSNQILQALYAKGHDFNHLLIKVSLHRS